MRSLFGLLVLLAATPAFAADPVSMTAASHASALDLTFTNATKHKLTMTTHVAAGIDHYDWLTVELTANKLRRTLMFVESRKGAAPIDEDIEAGKSITRSVDLAFWAIRQGEPLAPGDYDVVATWDTSKEARGPRFKATAKTKVTIAAPVEKSCKDKAQTGLELLVRDGNGKLEVGLHNIDATTHCVAGYIKTHEIQSDWLALDVDGKRTLHFDDEREKSYPVTIELAPGATAWTTWDLVDWAKRQRNGGKPISKGTTWATATFDASRERDTWRGKLSTRFVLVAP